MTTEDDTEWETRKGDCLYFDGLKPPTDLDEIMRQESQRIKGVTFSQTNQV